MLMCGKYALTVVSWLLFLSPIPGALAQAPRGIFVTPIPNEPFMAVVDEQRTSVQPNGTVVNVKTIHAIARSGQGQIYNEARPLVPADYVGTPPIRVMHIYDPQTRLNTFLYPQEKTGWQGRTPHPPATAPPDLYATPAANSLPVNQFTKEEDLGTQTMEGVSVHGVRETQLVPTAQGGSGKEVTITDEYWYSDDLRLNMVTKHNDPRTGSVSMTVTQVTRTEPDAAIFEIPSGYRLEGPAVQAVP
jgi:hypothetical protein